MAKNGGRWSGCFSISWTNLTLPPFCASVYLDFQLNQRLNLCFLFCFRRSVEVVLRLVEFSAIPAPPNYGSWVFRSWDFWLGLLLLINNLAIKWQSVSGAYLSTVTKPPTCRKTWNHWQTLSHNVLSTPNLYRLN